MNWIYIAPEPQAGERSPFGENGKLKITLSTDPWWKRFIARIRREPIWYKLGAFRED